MTTVVLLSGGQDSTTCLHWALNRGGPVVSVCFDYGQRHARELVSAARVAEAAAVPLHRIELRFLAPSALTSAEPIGTRPDGLPTTFVPGRNAAFLALAAGLGDELIIGCSAVDYSGYPDCRPEFLTKQAEALSLALAKDILILAPLIDRSKAQTVALAARLGPDAWRALGMTWTCYQGGDEPCGTCPACVLRIKGFAEAGMPDPAFGVSRS